MAGSVVTFRVSPNGITAVFIADKDIAGRFELYSVPVDGSAAPTKISDGLPFGGGDNGVRAFEISPDSASVVFVADANAGSGNDDIYSAPIDGSSAPVQLNAGAERPVTAFGITPNSAFAVFFGMDTSFGTNAIEVYSSTIGAAGSATQLSDVGQGNSSGSVVAADFSPDSARVVYAGDGAVNNVFQWYSVPVDAAGPGSDVQLSAALGFVSLGVFSPDSATFVYAGDDNISGTTEVFAVPIAGGASVQLNPAMAGSGATALEISPDGNWVGYLADQDSASVHEVYAAQMLVAGSGTRLNTAMAGSQFAGSLSICPDSGTVVFQADQDTPGTHELFGVPIDAGTAPSTLHGLVPPADVGIFVDLGLPIIDERVVYPVLDSTVDLFSVPFDGSAGFVQINAPVAAGDALFNAFLPPFAERLMAYGLGAASGGLTEEVHAAAVRGDLPLEQINITAGAGSLGVQDYQISSDEAFGVYLQDQDTAGKPELFSRELDSDMDTVINAADNCPFIVNPAQDPLVFGETVLPVSSTTFAWTTAADVRFVRGPLDMVDVLAVDDSGVVLNALSYSDSAVPTLGAGWYYLFAPDCDARSYQTTLGAEPNRDLAPLP
jgi:Tol biopolymer transport system component